MILFFDRETRSLRRSSFVCVLFIEPMRIIIIFIGLSACARSSFCLFFYSFLMVLLYSLLFTSSKMFCVFSNRMGIAETP